MQAPHSGRTELEDKCLQGACAARDGHADAEPAVRVAEGNTVHVDVWPRLDDKACLLALLRLRLDVSGRVEERLRPLDIALVVPVHVRVPVLVCLQDPSAPPWQEEDLTAQTVVKGLDAAQCVTQRNGAIGQN